MHVASGLTIGHVLRATSAELFAFGAIQDSDLPSTIARDTEVATAVSDHAAIPGAHHAAATVTGNGIQISGQQISLQIGTGSTQVAAGNHTHTYGDISGTGVVGRVAEFVTSTKTIQAANLIAPASNILTLTATAASTLGLAITAGKTLTLTATDNYGLTVAATASISGTNTGDVALASPNHGLSLTGQTLALGTPSTLTSTTTNAVTTTTHTHAITGVPALLGNGAQQWQTIVTGATPFVPVYSGFLLDGTTDGKTVFAVTASKTLTLTATDSYNLTVPATGTAALLATANAFTAIQSILSTTALQLKVGYDTTHYFTANVSAAGVTTFATLPIDAGVVFTPAVTFTAAPILSTMTAGWLPYMGTSKEIVGSANATLDASGNAFLADKVGIGRAALLKLDAYGTASSPATTGTTPNGLTSFLTSNGNSLYVGGYVESPYGMWLQVSNWGNLSDYYPLILNPLGGGIHIGGTSDPGNNNLLVDGAFGCNGAAAVSTIAINAISTTEQLRLGYDAANYCSVTVGSEGQVTFNAVGVSSAFTFSDQTTFAGGAFAASGNWFGALTDGPTGGFYAGSAADCELYRSAANTWYTPDTFHIAGNLLQGAGAVAYHAGERVLSCGNFSANGDCEFIEMLARRSVAHIDNSTWYELFIDGSSTRITIPADSVWYFYVIVLATTVDVGTVAQYYTDGMIKRVGNTTSAPVLDAVSSVYEGDAAWNIRCSADDTNEALKIEVLGNTGQTIRWSAWVRLWHTTFT